MNIGMQLASSGLAILRPRQAGFPGQVHSFKVYSQELGMDIQGLFALLPAMIIMDLLVAACGLSQRLCEAVVL